MSDWTLSLDLGQASDFSALVAVESEGDRFHVLGIERFDLGTPYPAVVERVLTLLKTPPLNVAPLVIDGTGVGRAVVDLFKPALAGNRLVRVSITAGQTLSLGDDGYWRVPKRDLVGAIQVPLQAGTLKIASRLPHASTLSQEMLNFKMKITQNANDTYAAWREGEHDDLVLALALALWWRQRLNRLLVTVAPQSQHRPSTFLRD